jgi:hypothetical protein
MRSKPLFAFLLGAFLAGTAGLVLGMLLGKLIPFRFPCHWLDVEAVVARPIDVTCDRARAVVKEVLEGAFLRRGGEAPAFDIDTADLVVTHWTLPDVNQRWKSIEVNQRWKSHFVPVGHQCSFHIQSQTSEMGYRYESGLQRDVFKKLLPKEARKAILEQHGCTDHE